MYSDIKTIFFNAAVQEQISNIVSHTIGIAFDLAYQNENILISDYEEYPQPKDKSTLMLPSLLNLPE